MKTAGSRAESIPLEAFFAGYPDLREIFDALLRRMEEVGRAEMRVTKSQVAFRAKKPFAWVWVPGKHLRGKIAPLVLSLSFPERDPSSRWKEIVEPARGRFMHHLELFSIQDLDGEALGWLRKAWELAGGLTD